MDQGNPANINNVEGISVPDTVTKIKSGIRYIKSRWKLVLIVSLLGAVSGVCYSIFSKTTYTANCTFVLEDSKSGGGLGQIAGLASLAGISLGGASGGGIFEGDNILELYKSRTMIEKAMLSTCIVDGKKQMLIDRFMDRYELRGKRNDGKTDYISFEGDPDNFSRKQDSVITRLAGLINKKILKVTKPDKKLSIFKVEVISEDEQFSKCFTDKMVENVNNFYIQTKVKKESQTVQILQHQADSVRVILNNSMHGVASANDAAPNPNPLMSTLRLNSQKKQVDVQASSAIYAEVVKNLELQKIALLQQMPLIQVVDKAVFPLGKNVVTKRFGGIIGMLIGLFLISLILAIIKTFE
jgi:hypothetical protein